MIDLLYFAAKRIEFEALPAKNYDAYVAWGSSTANESASV